MPTLTPGAASLAITGQFVQGPPATEITLLAPRATTVFENEQQVRLSPNDNFTTDVSETAGTEGIVAQVLLSPDSTVVEETITRVRKRGILVNALPAVSEPGSGDVVEDGEQLGNKTFGLQGGNVPQVPTVYGYLFIDPNNNILDNSADGKVEITYDDDASVNRVESKQLSIDGLGPHFTNFNVGNIISVVGTLFDTSGLGAPTALDQLIVGPFCPDTVHDIVATNGGEDESPFKDPNDSNDGDASYIASTEVTDQKFYCGFPDMTGLNAIHIISVQFRYFFKNLSGGGSGIEGIFRNGSGGSDITVTSTFTTAGTESGAYIGVNSSTFTENPDTNHEWILSDITAMEVGVRFKGDTGPIEKRCAFIKVLIRYRAGFLHPTIHGDEAANIVDLWQVVAKDPFVTPTDDDTQHIAIHTDFQNQFLRFQMPDLEARATTAISVETNVRATYKHVGEKNGAPENDFPCATGTAPLSNNVERNRHEGPREQINLGGMRSVHNLPGIIESGRFFVGPGDPSGGCGTFKDTDGNDVGFGTYIDFILNSTLDSASTPIDAVDVNGMEVGLRMNEQFVPEYRISRIYTEVEYFRLPTGSDFFHLVVDEDPAAPDDTDFMASMHSANKLMGVDFAGIPEVTQVNSITVIMRAEKDGSAVQGWRAILRIPGQTDHLFTVETNTAFATREYTLTTNPNTGDRFTRTEVNSIQVLFQSIGETPYFPKNVSLIRLRVNFIPIPSKIDNTRRINSERLLMLGKPVGLMRWTTPMSMADVDLMRDVAVSHRAVPRIGTGLGLEQWDRALMRDMTKSFDLDNDRLKFELFDLRDYLVLFLFTGQSSKKGRSFDGMMLITNGVTVRFTRATNAYMEDPFSGRLLELNSDEPQVTTDGVFIENNRTNLILNAGFSLGATDVFTDWSNTGLPAAGASIVEDETVLGWDTNFVGAPQRSVKLTGADTPADIYISNTPVEVPTGDNLSPEGSRFVAQVFHQDPSGIALSVAFAIDPPGFAERHFRVGDQTWNTGGIVWFDLPVSTVPVISRVPGHFPNMEFISASPASPTRPFKFKVGVRNVANQVNHLFAVQLEGGDFEAGTEATYPSSMIHTATGPVVRQLGDLKVPNIADHPTYFFTRGTFFCIVEPNWDSADLPWFGGAKRYIYSNVLDVNNHDRLWYDQDTESFVFERKVATVVSQATAYLPAVSSGVPIRVATRWISNLGDLGEMAFSIQIFVNDIRGVDGTPAATPVVPAETDFYIGSEEALDGTAFDGKIRRIRVTQFVLPQDKIEKLR